MFSYTVRCVFTNRQVVRDWLRWLQAEHIADVLEAGAVAAEIFEMDGDLTYEIRYAFPSEAAFANYEREHAPRLRNAGLEKFPLELGLEYSRTTGRSLQKFPG